MKVKIKRNALEQGILSLLCLVMFILVIIGVSFNSNYVIGADNITNRTVIARVNVTNTEPNITSVDVDDNISSPAGEIDLVANSVVQVYCNATVFDYNGWQDIDPNSTNATLYIVSVGRDGPTDNNYRYRNESCGSCRQATVDEAPNGETATHARCDCKFAIQYYANSSDKWVCNITVRDRGGVAINNLTNFSDTAISSEVTITKLLAIDTGSLIDYGNLSVTQTSDQIVHNVTNVGNTDLNLTLRGYGGTNESVGTNLSMICDFGNITFGHQRYLVGSEYVDHNNFDTMINLTNQTIMTNLTLSRRTNDTAYGSDRNSTIWKLQVPLSVGGICNGTIIFGAVERTT